MFSRKKIDLKMIDPTSKISLKMSCLAACGNDVAKAKELYEYMIAGSENIPDYPAPRPTAIQQFTQQVDGLFGWIDQNGDKLIKGYNMIQMFRGGQQIPAAGAAGAVSEIPPLPPLE